MEFPMLSTNGSSPQPSDFDSCCVASKLDSPVDSDVEEFFMRPGYRARCRKNTIDPELAVDGAYPWQCWVCGRIFYSLSGQSSHMRKCVIDRFTVPSIEGCPFCPKTSESLQMDTFPMRHFNRHMFTCHPSVAKFQCGYCLRKLSTATIEELACHMICYHRLPWRPSPISMSYLREDDLPHRTVTCMGCGWCTIVLRADNAVHPPSSIVAHMKNCAYRGGQVRLQPLSSTALTSSIEQNRLICEAERLGRLFAESYPLVRGYPLVIPDDPFPPEDCSRPKVKLLSSKLDTNEDSGMEDLLSNRMLANGWIEFQRPHKKRKTKSEVPIEFDVSLTLPPVPTHNQLSGAHKKISSAGLYVCPLCGDNALSTLRERDEHLQAAHNGELVFPCQVCGLAYPLYIALRRHAALKHDSQFDLVRYGPPELVDSSPTECPECELVAFTDKHVLKLHMAKLHNIVLGMTRKPSKSSSKKSSIKRPASDSPGSHPKESKAKVKRLSALSSKLSRSVSHERSKSNHNSSDPIFSGISHLERVLSRVSGASAPATCRACHTSVDNEKELRLHLELDHSETEQNCEQLGCQACGRIFFGSGGRIDLIGHLRVIHQESEQVDVLTCPHATETPPKCCNAHFSSPRLRQLHIAATTQRHPSFSCPLSLNLPGPPANGSDGSLSHDQLHRLIMDTEVAADQEGLMILAYCCPNCSRLFAGEQATARFAVHRIRCQPEQQPKTEEPQTLADVDSIPDSELKLEPTTSFEVTLVEENADDPNKLF